jgi:tetratricopeptide (TPR) repeat protein
MAGPAGRCALLLAVGLLPAGGLFIEGRAQQALPAHAWAAQAITIEGRVVDAGGNPVRDAVVRLEPGIATGVARASGIEGTPDATTDSSGRFALQAPADGVYSIHAEKAGWRSRAVVLEGKNLRKVDLVLEPTASGQAAAPAAEPHAGQAMEFADAPSFTIAGVTDWTAVGGHGSDSTLRTSEDLARQTAALRAPGQAAKLSGTSGEEPGPGEAILLAALAKAPASYAANHALGEYYLQRGQYRQAIPMLESASSLSHAQPADEYSLALACRGVGDLAQARLHVERALTQLSTGSMAARDAADLHRLAGQLDEQLNDPLAAVREDEQAVRLDPSEENYFAWGAELLLHRAVWQAAEVFRVGAGAHPASARMLSGWGAALFAGALYDQAAQRLCQASDLNPADPEPYLFLGRIELASPAPLPCVEQKLARFVGLQPASATANYLYAMAVSRRAGGGDPQLVETLLTRAAALQPPCGDAYLQLGIAAFARRDYARAIDLYTRAIAADPQQAEVHYRLGVAYDRTGDPARARREFELHDQIEKTQADAVERQRRDVKQFLVVLEQGPGEAKR